MLITFIRRPDVGPARDDTLEVIKLGENNLRIVYTERSEDGVLRDTSVMCYQRFLHYIWRLLWMLTIDNDPFQSVQFFVPGYPTVLIPVSTLNQHTVTIMDILMTTCWQWPTAGRAGATGSLPTV